MAITIAITSGSGYFGSVYTQTGAAGAGQWYADETPIAGQTGNTYTMEAVHEGKKITYRTASPAEQSNAIHLFVPSDVPGTIVGWFDAARTDLITLVGVKISALASKVGSLIYSQATDANRPSYSATGRNGKPALMFTPFQILTANTPSLLPGGANPSTLSGAAYSASTNDNFRSIMGWGYGNTGGLYRNYGKDRTSSGTDAVSADAVVAGPAWRDQDRIFVSQISTTTKSTANGQYDSTVLSTPTLNTSTPTYSHIGKGRNDDPRAWDGSMQELIIHGAELTLGDRQRIEGYLASKWDLRGLLPASHPYKSDNPPVGLGANLAAAGLLPTAEVLAEANADQPLSISVTAGTGYFGSTYTVTPAAVGQWYAGATAIPGATNPTYVMESRYEGRQLQFRAANGRRSNVIQLWTPDTIPSLVGWWDASRSDLMTLVSNAVSLWTSRVGTGRTLSQSTAASRPTYNATARNGKPGVVADGSDDILQIDNPTYLPAGTNPSAIAATAFFANVTVALWRTLAVWSSAILYRSLAKNPSHFVAQGGGSAATDNVSAVVWQNADRIAIGQHASGQATIHIDGNTTPVSKAVATSGTTQASAFVFGSATSGDRWNGVLQDLCIFNAPLSADDRLSLEGYMASKWGLRALLPAGHIYKASNPPPAGNKIDGVGLLPTTDAQAKITQLANVAANGLLPTAAVLSDTAQPGPITITVTSGTGYAGSVYERDSFAAGYWWAGNTRLDAEQGMTLTMRAEWEGRTIQFRAENGFRSNGIDLFVPAELFGLLAQFDAYAENTITHVGGVVSQWASKWGSWTATQAVEASKPSYSATGRNGRPAMLADGVADHFVINPTGDGIPDNGEESQIIALAFFSNVTINAYRMLIKWGSVNTARRGIAKSDSHHVTLIGGTSQTNTQSGVSWPNNDRIVSAEYQAVGARLNVNGGGDIINANVFNPNDQDAAYIFRDAGVYWNGSAQEILIWNRRLEGLERQKVEGYLASKWGMRALLPADHPYKSSNPPPNQSGSVPGVGYLPTAEIVADVPIVVTPELNGYLPTAAVLAVSAPAEFDGELNGYLPETEITGQQQTRVWADVDGLLPFMEAEFDLRYPVTAELNGYLPTAELAVDFPIRANLDLTGFLPVAEIGGESVYEVDIEAFGLLPTAEVSVEPFKFEITAEVNGILPTMESLMAATPKVTVEGEGYLPFAQAFLEFPARIMADMEGYLPTAEINAGPVIKLDIELFGLLPFAEIAAEPFKYEATADVTGFLPVSEIGGESVYEITVEGFGLLPTTDALIEVPQTVDATVFGYGILPTAEATLDVRHVVTVAGMGYLATMEAVFETGPVEVTLNLTGYLPTSSSTGGGGEPERPAAYTPSASSANSTLTVGGGPVLSRSGGIKVG